MIEPSFTSEIALDKVLNGLSIVPSPDMSSPSRLI